VSLHRIIRLPVPILINSIFVLLSVSMSAGCSHKIPYLPPNQVANYISSKMGVGPTREIIVVDARKQTLSIVKGDQVKKTFTIATGRNGLGQAANSLKTPLGLHRINEKIGDGVPKYGIFNRRHYVGTTAKKLPQTLQKKDYISTRILRLEGLQPGFNKGRDWVGRVVDTERRAVYIHGTTFEKALGFPSTKGCVHMSADDVISLFNSVPVGTLVWIN
jgi:lipoprotein-anchoring transpeptidase ErfK/SrfK